MEEIFINNNRLNEVKEYIEIILMLEELIYLKIPQYNFLITKHFYHIHQFFQKCHFKSLIL